jgi:uncharacterized membrane protein
MLQSQQVYQERLLSALVLFALAAIIMFMPEQAYAVNTSSGDTEWGMGDVWTRIESFFRGTPGLIITLFMLIASIYTATKSMIMGGIILVAAIAIFYSTRIAQAVTGLVI